MKAVLAVTVLLSCVLAVTAAAVVAVEPAPPAEELEEVNQVVENEVDVIVPEEEVIETFPAEEMASPVGGRFFACPTGWVRYKNGCYLYVSSSKSWSSALAYCENLGSSLATVSDVFDYSFLQELTRRSGHTISWMGGFYFQGWRWVDHSSFSYSFWSAQHSVSRYQCIHVNARAGWSNNGCSSAFPSICMKRTDTC